jgi:[ribosomal protein S5]-alanine N-acetyltransferase
VSEPNVVETERLDLRRLTLNDLDALAAIYSDADVRQYFPKGILTYEQTKEELEWIINVYYGQYGFGLWATTLNETNEFIGRCGLLPWTIDGREEWKSPICSPRSIGGGDWGLRRHGRSSLIGFGELHLSRLICLIDPANEASVKVAIKIGMSLEREAEIDGEPRLVYSADTPA